MYTVSFGLFPCSLFNFTNNSHYDEKAECTIHMYCYVLTAACPQGMMYEQCGYYATCSYLNVSTSSIGCQSGCFCEDSTIHYDGSCAEIDICGNSFTVL